MKLSLAVINRRLEYAASVGWDIEKCMAEWGKSYSAAKAFIQIYKNVPSVQLKKPYYENQWILDLQVLTREEYMKKYRLANIASYYSKLYAAERKTGERIATPKIRQKWEKEYWDKLG
jgi:hypothetical protein